MTIPEVYALPIPYVQSMINARVTNIQESRHRTEKSGEINVYTKEDFYGMRAITSVVNALFDGKGDDSNKNKGAQNISAVRDGNKGR